MAADDSMDVQPDAADGAVVESGGTSPVLSEDEVKALVAGVENGEIEVHSASGPRAATVRDFDVPRRSRIVSRSLPKLDLLNDRMAERLQLQTQQLLGVQLTVEASRTDTVLFGDLIEADVERQVGIEFSASPLSGHGALVLQGSLVDRLVELYFGGGENDARDAAHGDFTAGVMRVIDAYGTVVLDVLKTTWASLHAIAPQAQRREVSLNLLSIADENECVLRTLFEYDIAGRGGTLGVLLPEKMIGSLLPVFRGDNRVDDVDKDRAWRRAIEDGLPDLSVDLASTVGQATMTLGELICLEPGDIIGIENPTDATLLANGVRLLTGRFGVHAGRNAVAATRWMTTTPSSTQEDRHG